MNLFKKIGSEVKNRKAMLKYDMGDFDRKIKAVVQNTNSKLEKLNEAPDKELQFAIKGYNSAYSFYYDGIPEALDNTRETAVSLIKEIETFINTIANSEKHYRVCLDKIRYEKKKYCDNRNAFTDKIASTLALSGIVSTTTILPHTSALLGLTGCSIFGVAGSIATGAIAMGPISLVMTSGLAIGHTIEKSRCNKLAAAVKKDTEEIREMAAKLRHLQKEIVTYTNQLEQQYKELKKLKGSDYEELGDEQKLQLGALVNNTKGLAAKLNAKII